MLRILPFILLIAMTGCREYAYYMSPFQSNDHPYRDVPRYHDGNASATYASGALMAGRSNDALRDHVLSFQGSLYEAHHFGAFQAYYGANLSLGNYRVKPYHGPYDVMDTTTINLHAGNKFFGGIGGIGGIDWVTPLGRGEWRILQVEATVQHEFGDYLSFRKRIPDTGVDAISRVDPYATISIGTDLVGPFRRGTSGGYKFALIYATKRLYGDFDGASYIVPAYLSQTIHFTRNRHTSFFQVNIGSHTFNCLFGLNINISGKRK